MLFQIDIEILESQWFQLYPEWNINVSSPSFRNNRHDVALVLVWALLLLPPCLFEGVALGCSDSFGLREVLSWRSPSERIEYPPYFRVSGCPNAICSRFPLNWLKEFFLVKNELPALNAIQAEMALTQTRGKLCKINLIRSNEIFIFFAIVINCYGRIKNSTSTLTLCVLSSLWFMLV